MFKYDYAGYPTFKGQVLNGDQLWDLIEGLAANDLLYYTHLLTGYISFMVFLSFFFLFTKYIEHHSIFANQTNNFSLVAWTLLLSLLAIEPTIKMKDKPRE